ncbi:MAG: hypothetical protein QG652_1073 [Pseudomonadota bacterium]|nr:hypothetical protein [Pseudomonadota bacterium]
MRNFIQSCELLPRMTHATGLLVHWLVLVMLCAFAPGVVRADENAAVGIRLKTAYLINFARFVYWPAAEEGLPLQVCIVNGDAYRELAAELKPTTVQQRRVSMLVVSAGEAVPAGCNIIFISHGHQRDWPRILESVKGRAVLTVGEEDDFIASGGMTRFYYENKKLRFAADPDQARSAGVQISAKLLELAKIESGPECAAGDEPARPGTVCGK